MTEQNNSEETLIEFPCEFPIKVMAVSVEQVRLEIEAIVEAHPGQTGSITARDSRTGKFVAYTVVLAFTSKAQLDDTYRLLHALDGVHMVL